MTGCDLLKDPKRSPVLWPEGALIILNERGKLMAVKAHKENGILRASDVNNVNNVTKCQGGGW